MCVWNAHPAITFLKNWNDENTLVINGLMWIGPYSPNIKLWKKDSQSHMGGYTFVFLNALFRKTWLNYTRTISSKKLQYLNVIWKMRNEVFEGFNCFSNCVHTLSSYTGGVAIGPQQVSEIFAKPNNVLANLNHLNSPYTPQQLLG